jgi:hypothetical protein
MQIKMIEIYFQNNVKVVHIWLSRRTSDTSGSILIGLELPTSSWLFFLWRGTTCASLSLLGNEAFSIVLFISIVIDLLTIGFAIFKIFAEIPSLPVQV